ncbi:hypothetical protein [Halolamina salifodinae]|uniref:O-acetylhomoserine/O-acetylserine sulfhydrylase-like pyridoxal-dependent enzyme n=1 Tax=Halolamina salifodinae TaxID=1202767 RepID=A0A8T4GU69_9EURY|nr:hypothetical protein [Halolamina salifodinae]MBP1985940.1 O-acetylhomoserine/O-acetylserine sulfhydrylase-like pyridoxal-dependent enzyme [Halolamina salifodinae]
MIDFSGAAYSLLTRPLVAIFEVVIAAVQKLGEPGVAAVVVAALLVVATLLATLYLALEAGDRQ